MGFWHKIIYKILFICCLLLVFTNGETEEDKVLGLFKNRQGIYATKAPTSKLTLYRNVASQITHSGILSLFWMPPLLLTASSKGNIDVFEILPYELQAYREVYGDAFITEFKHDKMIQGAVDIIKVKEIVSELNRKTVHRNIQSIFFDEQHIDNYLSGGSCSAISFKVAKVVLDYLKNPINDREEGVLQSMKNIVETIHTEGLKDSKIGSDKSQLIRSTQAAFNTISINRTINAVDICQDKIKAIAAYYDIEVSQSTKDLLLEETNASRKKFEAIKKELKSGLYLLRIIQKNDNQRLERHGHSTIYVKSPQGKQFYFDPQIGLYDLSKRNQKTQNMIFQSLCSAKKRFEIEYYKFHKLR